MIYLTSDLHLYHRFFIYEPRGFQSAEDMNAAIEKNWNEIVNDDDDVYILGDLMVGGKEHNNEEGMTIIRRLKGKKHIILGNHDTDARIDLYKNERSIIEVLYAKLIRYKGREYYLSHFPSITVDLETEKKPKEWTVNFFGHTHSKEKFYNGLPYMYNVSLDAHDNRPVSIDEAIDDVKVKTKEYLSSR